MVEGLLGAARDELLHGLVLREGRLVHDECLRRLVEAALDLLPQVVQLRLEIALLGVRGLQVLLDLQDVALQLPVRHTHVVDPPLLDRARLGDMDVVVVLDAAESVELRVDELEVVLHVLQEVVGAAALLRLRGADAPLDGLNRQRDAGTASWRALTIVIAFTFRFCSACSAYWTWRRVTLAVGYRYRGTRVAGLGHGASAERCRG